MSFFRNNKTGGMMTRDAATDRAYGCAEQVDGTGLAGGYSIRRILALWVAATVPMMILAWAIMPLLIPHVKLPPVILFWLMLLPGMLWQLALSLWIIRDKEGGLNLYYFAVSESSLFTQQYLHNFARAIRQILQINEQLPPGQKIRVISLSTGWQPELAGYYDLTAAVEEAQEKEIFIACLNMEEVYGFKFEGLGRRPMADPDDFNSYEPSVFSAEQYFEGSWSFDGLYFPMESKTVASSSGVAQYEFDRYGGWSWISPYLAGVYALAAQADPAITPEEFWSIALATGRYIDIEHEGISYTLGPILDPVAVIEAVQK
jgi:hypothetical protein